MERSLAGAPAPSRRLTVGPLIAATYFMVCGGPYGLEEVVGKAGYDRTLIILLLTPLVWSLPTALMVGELSGALPEEGGYYAWVRRALGPFWGFQEAWLSLAASVFDMAIYPTLFVTYLGRLFPSLASGWPSVAAGVAMIAVCALWNLRGARAVGVGLEVLTFALLAPFVALSASAFTHPAAHAPPLDGASTGVLGGMLVAMWNYMGWDNASTIAGEVDRPQRNYPLAMLWTVAAVALTYVVPVLACRRAGIDPRGWDTGAWVQAGGAIGGPWLARLIVVGGVVCAIGMFNALVLSYSRVPLALARDGFLPRFLARTQPVTGTPTAAVIVCAVLYAVCLSLGFDRLIELDVMLYGLSLLLEFVSLVALRLREPSLERPFRVPGGVIGCVLVGVAPMTLTTLALIHQGGTPAALQLGAGLVAGGVVVYGLRKLYLGWTGAT
jgi:amino acid transporter